MVLAETGAIFFFVVISDSYANAFGLDPTHAVSPRGANRAQIRGLDQAQQRAGALRKEAEAR